MKRSLSAFLWAGQQMRALDSPPAPRKRLTCRGWAQWEEGEAGVSGRPVVERAVSGKPPLSKLAGMPNTIHRSAAGGCTHRHAALLATAVAVVVLCLALA